jgi:dihydroneopterin aldolase
LVEIKDVKLKAYFVLNELSRDVEIGCAEEEHGVKQKVSISMRVMFDGGAMFSGEMDKPPYDYCDIIKAVDDAIASQPRFILQETLFFAIARRVLSHPFVEGIELSLSKTQRYVDCRSLGVQAILTKADIQHLSDRYAE